MRMSQINNYKIMKLQNYVCDRGDFTRITPYVTATSQNHCEHK